MIETSAGSDTYMTVAKSYADDYAANLEKYEARVLEAESKGLGAAIQLNGKFIKINKFTILWKLYFLTTIQKAVRIYKR
jgi:hypothetical protein